MDDTQLQRYINAAAMVALWFPDQLELRVKWLAAVTQPRVGDLAQLQQHLQVSTPPPPPPMIERYEARSPPLFASLCAIQGSDSSSSSSGRQIFSPYARLASLDTGATKDAASLASSSSSPSSCESSLSPALIADARRSTPRRKAAPTSFRGGAWDGTGMEEEEIKRVRVLIPKTVSVAEAMALGPAPSPAQSPPPGLADTLDIMESDELDASLVDAIESRGEEYVYCRSAIKAYASPSYCY